MSSGEVQPVLDTLEHRVAPWRARGEEGRGSGRAPLISLFHLTRVHTLSPTHDAYALHP